LGQASLVEIAGKWILGRARVAQDQGTPDEIIEQECRKHNAEPRRTNRLAAKMAEIGVQRFKKLDDLRAKSGKDFDSAYDHMQMQAHEQAVALFEQYARHGENPDLTAWATKTLRI
jgi:predicted outer membrane protein